jgi:hypothetical protein
MNIDKRCVLIAVCFASVAGAASCRRPEPPRPSATAPAAAAAPKLSKIVFVGKEHACDCTRKAVDASWTALQKALGPTAKLPIEKMYVDTEAARVEAYRSQKPIMALPAIYFVDGQGTVLDQLQGEVNETQVQPILSKLQ